MARESWGPFLKKGPYAFASVVRLKAAQLSFSLVAQHLFKFRGLAHVNRLLCSRNRNRWRIAQTFRKIASCGLQFIWSNDTIDHSQPQSFLSLDRFAQEEHLACFVWRNEVRQEVCATPVGMQAHLNKRLAES